MSDNDDAEGGGRLGATNEEAVEPRGSDEASDDPNRASFSPWDELHETFGDTKAIEVVVDDGLPTVRVPEGSDAHAPALSHAEFCCLEDTTKFVIRGPWGEIAAEFDPKDVERARDGRYRCKIDHVLERFQMPLARMKKEAEAVARAQPSIGSLPPLDDKAALMALLESWRSQNGGRRGRPAADPDWVEVEPIRPVCSHLVLQLVPLTESQKAMGFNKGWLNRYCSVRRTVAGAFMELTNDAMRACNLRDPVDRDGLELMREFDDVQLERSKSRELLPLFRGTPAAPAPKT